MRVDSVYFATEIKRRERNKQFVMSESTKVTKARKHDYSWACAEIFPWGGNVGISFIIFKLLTISVPSKIILHWANIYFSEHDILGLSKWSFQWIKHCELYNKYKILSKYEQNTHFIQIAPCFRGSFHYFEMLQVRENEISLRNSSGGPEYLRTLQGTLLTMKWKCSFTEGFVLSTLQRKCPMLR